MAYVSGSGQWVPIGLRLDNINAVNASEVHISDPLPTGITSHNVRGALEEICNGGGGVPALNARVTTLEGEMTTAQGDISALETDVGAIQTSITAIEADLNDKVETIQNKPGATGYSLIDSRVGDTVNLNTLVAGSGINLSLDLNGNINVASSSLASVSSVQNTGAVSGSSMVLAPYTTTPTVRKVIAGSNITLTEDNTPGSESLTVAASGGGGGVTSLNNTSGSGNTLVVGGGTATPTVRTVAPGTSMVMTQDNTAGSEKLTIALDPAVYFTSLLGTSTNVRMLPFSVSVGANGGGSNTADLLQISRIASTTYSAWVVLLETYSMAGTGSANPWSFQTLGTARAVAADGTTLGSTFGFSSSSIPFGSTPSITWVSSGAFMVARLTNATATAAHFTGFLFTVYDTNA